MMKSIAAVLAASAFLAASASADPWRSEDRKPLWSYRCGAPDAGCDSLAPAIVARAQPPEDANALLLTVAVGEVTALSNADCEAVDDPYPCCTGVDAGTCETVDCVVSAMADLTSPLSDVLVTDLVTFDETGDNSVSTTAIVSGSSGATNEFDTPSGTTLKRWILPYNISLKLACTDNIPAVLQVDAYYHFAR